MLRALRLSSPSLRLLARPLERRTCATGTSAVGTLHRKGMNLLELLSTLPNKGVGAKVYRESWVAKGCARGSQQSRRVSTAVSLSTAPPQVAPRSAPLSHH